MRGLHRILVDLFGPRWRHGEWQIRRAAVARLDDPSLLAGIALGDPAPDVCLAAVAGLSDPSSLLRIATMDRSDPRSPDLAAWHSERWWPVRAAAIAKLADRVQAQVLLLRIAREDASPKAREAAAGLLEDPLVAKSVAEEIARDRIRAQIRSRDWSRVSEAGELALEPLLQAVQDRAEREKGRIAQLLGDLRDPRATLPLTETLITGLRSTRGAAGRGLAGLGPIQPFHLDHDFIHNVCEALVKIGDPGAVAPLRRYLAQMRAERALLNPDVARVLVFFGTPEAVTALMETCRSGLGQIQSLHSVGNPLAVGVLCAGLDDADPHIQGACADALWRIATGRPGSAGLLSRAIREKVSRIRIACPYCQGSGRADVSENDVYYGRCTSDSCGSCSGQGHYYRADQAFLEPVLEADAAPTDLD
jgi:HEAT repeat protein